MNRRRQSITTAEFAKLAAGRPVTPRSVPVLSARENGTVQPDSNGRIIRFTLSDPSVARDGHTIAADAWQLNNYRLNPVFLWAHNADEPPIGRMVEIGTQGQRLVGSVEFPKPSAYAFADTIYQLYRGGYLNAVSVAWLPIEWKFSQDRSRPGGVDFMKVELLEVSAVPVPALPTALATARAAGIDTRPMRKWLEAKNEQERDRARAKARLHLLRLGIKPAPRSTFSFRPQPRERSP